MSIMVPNPFKLMDDFLLDHVFNPLTWRLEYNFGWNAMDLRMLSAYSGVIFFMVVAFFEKSYLLFGLCLLLFSLLMYSSSMIKSKWVQNNRTGKNILRIEGFSGRRVNDCFGLYIVLMHYDDNFILVSLGFSGWFFAMFATSFLDATDALPPQYREFKTVPQT